jgi:probable F420-dependent oxidoreductase
VYHDKAVLAAYLAGTTERIRFTFYAMIVPYHHPIEAAKTIATLDHVTDGRVILGVGVGWLEPEFDRLGVSYQQRGAITDEYLEAMVSLWTEDTPSFHGDHVRFDESSFLPKCKQRPHVPIWVGGAGPAAARRAVGVGRGWMPLTGTTSELTAGADRIQGLLAERGRDVDDFDFVFNVHIGERSDWNPHRSFSYEANGREEQDYGGHQETSVSCPYDAGAVIESIRELQQAGCTHVNPWFSWQRPDELRGHLDWFAEKVMAAFADDR